MDWCVKKFIWFIGSRKAITQEIIGSSNPATLAEVMLNWDSTKDMKEALKPLKLLPHNSRFIHVIDYWEAALFPNTDIWEKYMPDEETIQI
jgi:hypothetical protein